MARGKKTVEVRLPAGRAALAPEKVGDPEVLAEALGVTAETRVLFKFNEIARLLWLPETLSQTEVHARLTRAIELYEGLAPSDTGEAMLAQQMVGTHEAAMECLRRASLPGQSFEGRDMSLKHAAKLMTLYEKQLRTHQKSKGKGQQKVTVEHVHVAAGGQAIVGNVETGTSPAPAKAEDGGDAASQRIAQTAEPLFDMKSTERAGPRRRRS